MVLLVHGSSSVDGSPKDGVQEGDGLEGQEQLRFKKNKKSNLGSLVWLVVFRLLVVVPSLLVDGSKCDHVNANLCNLTRDVISFFPFQCQRLVKVLPAVCDSDHGDARINVNFLLVTTAVFSCNSTSMTLNNFYLCQSQVQSNSSVSLTVEAHCIKWTWC